MLCPMSFIGRCCICFHWFRMLFSDVFTAFRGFWRSHAVPRYIKVCTKASFNVTTFLIKQPAEASRISWLLAAQAHAELKNSFELVLQSYCPRRFNAYVNHGLKREKLREPAFLHKNTCFRSVVGLFLTSENTAALYHKNLRNLLVKK